MKCERCGESEGEFYCSKYSEYVCELCAELCRECSEKPCLEEIEELELGLLRGK